jgi:hypothetical protein
MLGRTSVLSGYLRGAEFKFWPCTDSLSEAFYGFHQLYYEFDRILCQITAQMVSSTSLSVHYAHRPVIRRNVMRQDVIKWTANK